MGNFNTKRHEFSLIDFPPEILEHVLSFVDTQDLFRISLVSHHFAETASSDHVWRAVLTRTFPEVTRQLGWSGLPIKSQGMKFLNGTLLFPPGIGSKVNPLFKISVLGKPAAGKHSLIRHYLSNQWGDTRSITNYYLSTINNLGVPAGLHIERHGADRGYFAVSHTMRHAQCLLMCIDISDQKWREGWTEWMNQLEISFRNAELEGFIKVVIGTKADLRKVPEVECVPREAIMEECSKKDFVYFEASAKTGAGVFEAFDEIMKIILHRSRRYLKEFQQTSIPPKSSPSMKRTFTRSNRNQSNKSDLG